MAELSTEKVEIPVAGAEAMGAYVARPKSGGPFPAVLVFEEIFGINAHIREIAERIAREGYLAVAPDYHHRAWPRGSEIPYGPEGMKKGMELIPKLTAAGLSADIEAAVAYARARNDVRAERLGAIGFCIGGHVAYLAAATQPIAATASFYGGGIATFSPGGGPPTVTRSGDIKGRILCLFGKNDSMISQDNVRTIAHALEQHHVRHEIVVYEDCGHAFMCAAAERGSHNAKAASDAWERVKRLFAEELRK
jgi:carboxymethylenebutenolidase